ncbi:MAG: cyclodeaminase/cyclohydrolase family protein [Anaerolineae bacterium]|nr:cyclodeaminase/cyclohydrolase family protein [Anaerolineae bacterium]
MTSGLIDTRFIDALATSEPTPGGGSAAAMAGAIGAGLLSMVCNLTVGQERFAAVEEEIRAVLEESESLRLRLVDLAERDMAAYRSFVEAQRLPRKSPEERRERTGRMQEALKACTLVPLEIAEACRRLLDLSPVVAEKGNPSAVTDVGVGALLAEAAMRGAGLQVMVNLAWLKDEAFIQEQRRRVQEVQAGSAELKERVVAMVEGALEG